MRVMKTLLAVVGFTTLVGAAKHQLIVGTFSTNFLYTVEYDDAAQTLELVHKTPTNAASSWISLSHDKKNLYGTDWNSEKPSFVSYSVTDPQTIEYQARVFGSGDCVGLKSIFITPSLQPPYAVYGNYFYGNAKCGNVMSVHDNGTLRDVIQGYEYADGSAVHGVSFSNDSQYLYSADDGGNAIWVHSINPSDGSLEYHSRLNMDEEKSDPRHVVTHPEGQYVYTVLEGTSQVAQFLTNELHKLYPMKAAYPLINDGDKASDYWADEIALSANNKYLWASNRAYDANRKGYISAIEVQEGGYLGKQYFLIETTNSGGFANAVAPSPFDDAIVALTDNSTGFIEVWKMDDDKNGARAVAHLDIEDGGGCCANAVWYS
ncbi:Lactonase, 7-bladed beta-propeller-domain-containing protein [Hypoxylon sp. NC0597]|nr:Lactonase, 7-bladed beta-propeller-domain-containing protein [Hypoxylon sp. NC0597]